MDAFIGVIGFLIIIIGLVMLVVALIRKKPKKTASILAGVGFALFITGLAMPSSSLVVDGDEEKIDIIKKEDTVVEAVKDESKEKEDGKAEKLAKEKEKAELEKKQAEYQKKKENEKKLSEDLKKQEEDSVENLTIDERVINKFDIVNSAVLNEGVLTLIKDPSFAWDETTYISNYALDFFRAMREGFLDPSVDKVIIVMNADLMDEKGHESAEEVVSYTYNRSTFESLNYENFIKLVFGEEWRIFTESDEYSIHLAIYWELEEKYREHLYLDKYS